MGNELLGKQYGKPSYRKFILNYYKQCVITTSIIYNIIYAKTSSLSIYLSNLSNKFMFLEVVFLELQF